MWYKIIFFVSMMPMLYSADTDTLSVVALRQFKANSDAYAASPVGVFTDMNIKALRAAKESGKKIVLMIGRGTYEGLNQEAIPDPAIRSQFAGAEVFFIDPLAEHHLDGDAHGIIAKLPSLGVLQDFFAGIADYVVVDPGVIQYMGYTGDADKYGQQIFAKTMSIVIPGARTKESFAAAPYMYQDYLNKNHADVVQRETSELFALKKAAQEEENALRGQALMEMWSWLKPAGKMILGKGEFEYLKEGFGHGYYLKFSEMFEKFGSMAPYTIPGITDPNEWLRGNPLFPHIHSGDGASMPPQYAMIQKQKQ